MSGRGYDEGTLGWRPDGHGGGSWRAEYSLTVAGKRKRPSKTVRHAKMRDKIAARRDAQAWLTKQLSLKRQGLASAPTSMTVAELLDRYMAAEGDAAQGWEPTYRWRNQQHVEQRLKPALGGIKLRDLRPVHVQEMVDALAEPGTKLADSPNRRSISENRALSGVTQRNILGVLNAALRYATQHRLIDHNPCDYVRKPRAVERKVKDHIWSGEQLRAFLDATAERRDWTLWWVAAYTAMRRSELLGLQWGDVDLDAATLRVQRRRVRVGTEMITGESTKTHKDRTVSIDPDTVAALRRWQRQLHEERLAAPPGVYAADSPWVFVDEIGRPTSADQVDGRWRRAMRNADADLPRIRFHDLRHTHASLLLAAGVDPIAVADRLGHANATMVLTVYGHAIKSRGPSIAAAFADAVGR